MASERLNLQLGKGKTPEEVFVQQTKRAIENKNRLSILEDYHFEPQAPQPQPAVKHQPPERKLLDLSAPIIREEVIEEEVVEEVEQVDHYHKFETLFAQLNELVPGFAETEEIDEDDKETIISAIKKISYDEPGWLQPEFRETPQVVSFDEPGWLVPSFDELLEETVIEEPQEIVEEEEYTPEMVVEEIEEDIPEIVEEIVTEDVIEEVVEEPPTETYMDKLVRGISEYTKKTPIANPEPKSDVDQKFELMEYQITRLKSYINEALGGMGGRNLVSGIGQGGDGQTPGGGAVQLWDLDDVAIGTPGAGDSYPELSNGDTLVWNSTLRKWEPGAGIGGVDIDFNSLKEGDVLTYDASANKWMARDGILSGSVPEQSSIRTLANKIESTDKLLYQVLDQLNSIHAVEVEENSVPDNTFYPGLGDDLIDTIPDGDTTTFIVTEDTAMGIYKLDDAPQPTVQVPRGDIIVFDLNALTDPTKFDVFQNGIILQNGRHYFSDTKLLRIRTGDIPVNIDKLFYRNTIKRGMGWIISITDN